MPANTCKFLQLLRQSNDERSFGQMAPTVMRFSCY